MCWSYVHKLELTAAAIPVVLLTLIVHAGNNLLCSTIQHVRVYAV